MQSYTQLKKQNTATAIENRYLVFSALLLLTMCIIGNAASTLGAVIVVLLCACFVEKPEFLLPVVLISSLLGDYFIAYKGIGMSRLTIIVYILLSFFHFLKNRQKISVLSVLFLVLASLFSLISAITSVTGILTPAISFVLNLVMLFCMANQRVENRDSFIRNFKFSLWIFSFFLFVRIMLLSNNFMNSTRLMFYGVNPNGLAMCFSQVIVFLLMFAYFEKNKFHMAVSIFFIIIDAYFLSLTGSRSAVVATMVAVILLLLIGFRGKSFFQYCLMITAIVVTIALGYYLLGKYAPHLLERFTVEDIVSTGGTNRLDIWEAAWKYVIPDNWLFGVGLGGGNPIHAMQFYVEQALGVHNLYITVLTQIGVFGSIFFYSFWIKCLSKGIKNSRQDSFVKIPLFLILTAFLNGVGEDVYLERFLWFSAGLVFLTVFNNVCGNWSEKDETSVCCTNHEH